MRPFITSRKKSSTKTKSDGTFTAPTIPPSETCLLPWISPILNASTKASSTKMTPTLKLASLSTPSTLPISSLKFGSTTHPTTLSRSGTMAKSETFLSATGPLNVQLRLFTPGTISSKTKTTSKLVEFTTKTFKLTSQSQPLNSWLFSFWPLLVLSLASRKALTNKNLQLLKKPTLNLPIKPWKTLFWVNKQKKA